VKVVKIDLRPDQYDELAECVGELLVPGTQLVLVVNRDTCPPFKIEFARSPTDSVGVEDVDECAWCGHERENHSGGPGWPNWCVACDGSDVWCYQFAEYEPGEAPGE
jgi:hypothetical protein